MFCDAVQKNPDELIELKMQGQRNVGTPLEFQMEELLEDFLAHPEKYFANVAHKNRYYAKYAKEGLTHASKVNISAAVLSFFKHNRRRLETQRLQPKEPKSRCPTLEQVQLMAEYARTARDKALIWFLASSPVRLGSIPLLKWSDLQPTGDKEIPLKLVLSSERLKGHGSDKYRGIKQICFVHWFAYRKLLTYKKELDRWLKEKGFEFSPEMPLFINYRGNQIEPLSPSRIRAIIEEACLSAFGDLEEVRFSPHDFRDHVNTAVINAGVPLEARETILGHKIQGTNKFYTDKGQIELLKFFKQGLPWLIPAEKQKTTLLATPPPLLISQIKKEHQKFIEQVKKLEEIIEDFIQFLPAEEKKQAEAILTVFKDKLRAIQKQNTN